MGPMHCLPAGRAPRFCRRPRIRPVTRDSLASSPLTLSCPRLVCPGGPSRRRGGRSGGCWRRGRGLRPPPTHLANPSLPPRSGLQAFAPFLPPGPFGTRLRSSLRKGEFLGGPRTLGRGGWVEEIDRAGCLPRMTAEREGGSAAGSGGWRGGVGAAPAFRPLKEKPKNMSFFCARRSSAGLFFFFFFARGVQRYRLGIAGRGVHPTPLLLSTTSVELAQENVPRDFCFFPVSRRVGQAAPRALGSSEGGCSVTFSPEAKSKPRSKDFVLSAHGVSETGTLKTCKIREQFLRS